MTEIPKIKTFQVSISLPKKDAALLASLRASFEEMGLKVNVEPSDSRNTRTVLSLSADKIPSTAEIFDSVAKKHGIRLSGHLIEQALMISSKRRQGNVTSGSIELLHSMTGEMSARRPYIAGGIGAFIKNTRLPGSAVQI